MSKRKWWRPVNQYATGQGRVHGFGVRTRPRLFIVLAPKKEISPGAEFGGLTYASLRTGSYFSHFRARSGKDKCVDARTVMNMRI